jgi:hypothetical protein
MNERGLNEENVKKLFSWEGFWKEIPWIVFWIILFSLIWFYRADRDACLSQLETPCVWECRVEEFRLNIQEQFPGATIQCDYETKSCMISGSMLPEGYEMPDFKDIVVDINAS